eukprot:TRINITY_DN5425_c0_g1_i2.p1 TRINITY_DN5425_c0_g1~~TRINITY_DN5425_c0_g1_i2.p1  ORF type:complete len:1060 (+),score=427.82 TRINITY_DN5425_c0_g1_i2:29-3181(+)
MDDSSSSDNDFAGLGPTQKKPTPDASKPSSAKSAATPASAAAPVRERRPRPTGHLGPMQLAGGGKAQPARPASVLGRSRDSPAASLPGSPLATPASVQPAPLQEPPASRQVEEDLKRQLESVRQQLAAQQDMVGRQEEDARRWREQAERAEQDLRRARDDADAQRRADADARAEEGRSWRDKVEQARQEGREEMDRKLREGAEQLESAKKQVETIQSDTARVRGEHEATRAELALLRKRDEEHWIDQIRDARVLREEKESLRSELDAERRKAEELQQVIDLAKIEREDPERPLQYAPPPQRRVALKDVPSGVPLTQQVKTLLEHSVHTIIEHQKHREAAMMEALRREQERWQKEMERRDREDRHVRAAWERDEREHRRKADEEDRLEREARDREDRAEKARRDADDRAARQEQDRDERAERLQAELRERDEWTKRERERGQAEQRQTMDRLHHGFKVSQEQQQKAFETQMQDHLRRTKDEKHHLIAMHQQQLEEMRNRYQDMIAAQESNHKTSLGVWEQHSANGQKLERCLTALNRNVQELEAFQNRIDQDRSALLAEREASLADREAIIDELRRSVQLQQESLERDRLGLQRLVVSFEVTVGNLEKRQEDERARLMSAAAKADSAREALGKDHRQWLQDSREDVLRFEEDRAVTLRQLADLVEDLKAERGALDGRAREMERRRDVEDRVLAQKAEDVQQRRDEVEKEYQQMMKVSAAWDEKGREIKAEFAALEQERALITREKDAVREQMWRAKEVIGNLERKSQEVNRVKQEADLKLDRAEKTEGNMQRIGANMAQESELFLKMRDHYEREWADIETDRTKVEAQKQYLAGLQRRIRVGLTEAQERERRAPPAREQFVKDELEEQRRFIQSLGPPAYDHPQSALKSRSAQPSPSAEPPAIRITEPTPRDVGTAAPAAAAPGRVDPHADLRGDVSSIRAREAAGSVSSNGSSSSAHFDGASPSQTGVSLRSDWIPFTHVSDSDTQGPPAQPPRVLGHTPTSSTYTSSPMPTSSAERDRDRELLARLASLAGHSPAAPPTVQQDTDTSGR